MEVTLDRIIYNSGFRKNHIAERMSIPDYTLSRIIHDGLGARSHLDELKRVLVDELQICSEPELLEAVDGTRQERQRKQRELWNEIVNLWHDDEQEQKRRRRKRKSSK